MPGLRPCPTYQISDRWQYPLDGNYFFLSLSENPLGGLRKIIIFLSTPVFFAASFQRYPNGFWMWWHFLNSLTPGPSLWPLWATQQWPFHYLTDQFVTQPTSHHLRMSAYVCTIERQNPNAFGQPTYVQLSNGLDFRQRLKSKRSNFRCS